MQSDQYINLFKEFCKKNNIIWNAGHGLNFKNVSLISKINFIEELNVGHFIISQSIFDGLENTIK